MYIGIICFTVRDVMNFEIELLYPSVFLLDKKRLKPQIL